MESGASKQPCLRAVLLLLVFLLFIPAVHFCISQIYYQRAQFLINRQEYKPAALLLNKAAEWLPWDSAIHQSLGMACLELAWRAEGQEQKLHYSLAVDHLRQAQQLNPLEPEIAVSLAAALELQGKSSPDEVLAAYRRAASLAPNMVQYVELLADKLAQYGKNEELLAAAETLGRIYPGCYSKIRSKSWWNPETEEQFRHGLLHGIAESGTWTGLADNDVRRARIVLAEMAAKKSDWAVAVEQQRLALALKPRLNGSRDYFQLARYYLWEKNIEAACEALFTGAAKEASAAAVIQQTMPLFQQTGQQDAIPDFYRQLRAKLSFSYVEDIQVAELLIKNKQHEFALELLRNVLAERDYLPKPWQLLAEIYRQQGKTLDMEAALSKAKLRMKQPEDRRRSIFSPSAPAPSRQP